MCPVHRKRSAKREIDDLLGRAARPLTHSREPFWRLVHAIQAASRLLAPLPGHGGDRPAVHHPVALACVRIADRHERWRRTPEAWSPPSASPLVQFRTLLSHLFDRYPVPNFMGPVWLCAEDKPWELDLYLHLAEGLSIRQFPLPMSIRVSKRAAAFFMQAPDDLHPFQSLRWGHVRSLGGDHRLARLLACRTILAEPTDQEQFWETVIRFLANHTAIPADEVLSIIQFIHGQRFQPASVVWSPSAGEEPLQPDFTLKERSLYWLRRHMANWRTEVAPRVRTVTPGRGNRPSAPSPPPWEPTAIPPFRHETANSLWTIDELLSDKELRIEGGLMQHCVATYIPKCARRETSIWSLKHHQGEHQEHVATIEVVPQSRLICQARGKRNADPGELAMHVVQQWADQEGLRFPEKA